MKKCFLDVYKNVFPNFKVRVCGGLLLMFSQTEGALSLAVVLGLGVLRSELPGGLVCVTLNGINDSCGPV